jgi:hypothetical protein
MPRSEFESTIPASERPQSHASCHAALKLFTAVKIIYSFLSVDSVARLLLLILKRLADMYRILHGGKYELLRRYSTDQTLRIVEPKIL